MCGMPWRRQLCLKVNWVAISKTTEREKNEEIERKPGDEFFAYAALGADYEKWVWKLALETQIGEPWVSFTGTRIVLSRSERELFHLQPSVGVKIGSGVLELGTRIPLAGRNFPAGPAAFLGYFYSWNWFMEPTPSFCLTLQPQQQNIVLWITSSDRSA